MDVLIVGTAGHIDHGKTTLVRALTGVDLDRLPEERARGITIALGFTHLALPSGRVASFVDVPGHERLVRTMIAGATGLDAALLCVSAVEGVMPQTAEHLAILELVGVRAGVVALTMCDLVDEEGLELARLDVADAVRGTFLEGAPVIATAAACDRRGLDELVAALDALPRAARDEAGPFRLPVDRAFVRRGFGTVVTGTIRSGAVRDGDEVEVLPGGPRARVRGLQVHGRPVERAGAGLRAALNLAGVERDDLARGMVIAHPGAIPPASVVDARARLLPEAPALAAGTRVRLLSGTAEVMAVLAPVEGEELVPGADALVQLRTEAPIVVLPGDRFVLRRESPVTTLGGGVVLDPWAPRLRRRDRERFRRQLRAIEAGDPLAVLERAGTTGLDPVRARLHGVPDDAPRIGGRALHPAAVAALERALLDALDRFHAEHPLRPGAPRRALASAGPLATLGERGFEDLLRGLVERGEVVAEGPRLRRPGFEVRLDGPLAERARRLEERVRAAGLEGPRLHELSREDPDLLRHLLDAGRLERVGDRVLHPAELEALAERVRAWLREHGEMEPPDFKALTGLSRQHAIPLLEWLDARGVTERRGNARVLR